MTLPVVFHELAESELNEASAYYARARPSLGAAFVMEVQQAVEAIAAAPFVGAVVDNDLRGWLVGRFPYRVFYRVSDDQVRVLAIAHQKRRPLYWHGRE